MTKKKILAITILLLQLTLILIGCMPDAIPEEQHTRKQMPTSLTGQ